MKIHEQSNRVLRELQVGDDLRLVNRQQAFDRLDFQDELAFDYEIQTVCEVDQNALIADWQWPLAIEAQTLKRELMSQAFLIRGLQQARSKYTVHLDAGAGDSLRQPPKSPRLPGSLFHVAGSLSECDELRPFLRALSTQR